MSTARQHHYQFPHYLRKSISYTDEDTAVTLGPDIPAGSLILKALSGVSVSTAFNAGTLNQIDIGTSADPNLYGTLLALAATDFVPLDEAVSYLVTQDTTMTATVTLTGTAATAGAAEVVIAYIPDNDG
jgi:hypothetical protein